MNLVPNVLLFIFRFCWLEACGILASLPGTELLPVLEVKCCFHRITTEASPLTRILISATVCLLHPPFCTRFLEPPRSLLCDVWDRHSIRSLWPPFLSCRPYTSSSPLLLADLSLYNCFFLIINFLLCLCSFFVPHVACVTAVPWPVTEPGTAVKIQSSNHWTTRELLDFLLEGASLVVLRVCECFFFF